MPGLYCEKIKFCIVTFSLTDFKELKLSISDIPEGRLEDFLLASAYLLGFKNEPMADGKRPSNSTYSKLSPSVYAYEQNAPFMNRDPRFYRTFAFPGVRWAFANDPRNDDNMYPYNGPDYVLWNYVWYASAEDRDNVESGTNFGPDGLMGNAKGIYVRKRSDDYDVNNSPLYEWSDDRHFGRSAAPWLHAGRGADLFVGKFAIGSLGEVHPDVAKALDVKQRMYAAEIDIESLLRYRSRGYKFTETGKYPPIERDIAVVVDENVEAAKILECANKAAGKALREAKIFDIYRSDALGKGKKSVAVKLEFRLPDRTLTDEEAQTATDAVLQKLAKDTGAVLR